MEACASAHLWSRAIDDLGHEVRLIPPTYVKPFVKCQKNDMADAAAIAEADLVLEVLRHVVRAMVMAQLQARGLSGDTTNWPCGDTRTWPP